MRINWTEPGSETPTWSDPGLLVLISLADGTKHGYGMVEDIRMFCGQRLGPGTLYGAIARLEKAGLIEPVEGPPRRRPYRLTSQGVSVLRSHLSKLQAVATAGTLRLHPE
jgi:DNA-binding PadR family transcriptional regulator